MLPSVKKIVLRFHESFKEKLFRRITKLTKNSRFKTKFCIRKHDIISFKNEALAWISEPNANLVKT